MRQLAWMYEGRSRAEWQQTAEIVASIRSAAFGGQPVRADDVNPWALLDAKAAAVPLRGKDVSELLSTLFVHRG